MSQARFLVTTADQRTWRLDRPVLFLGEWCRRYDAKHVWSQLDAVVAPPYGIQAEQKARDHAYLYSDLLPRLLRDVADALNACHKTDHGVRYWQILLGTWLQYYAQTVFNRYFTLEQAVGRFRLSGTVVLDAPAYSLATWDTRVFAWATSDDVWNHVLFAKLIRERGDIALEPDANSLAGVTGYTEPPEPPAGRRSRAEAISRAANAILPRLVRQHDALIIHSYLPKLAEVALQAALGQVPQLWTSLPAPGVPPDLALRRRLSLELAGRQGFERSVRALLFDAIPSCFLEGYAELQERSRTTPWPRSPKFIFTSNCFAYDEVFKAYTAEMTERCVPYFVGAHGSFGVSPHVECDDDSPEVQSCDRYFSWSWTNGNPRVVPAFLLKTAARRPRPHVGKAGGLLLVELFVPQRKTHWDSYYEFGVYQDEQFRFVEALPPAIRGRLTVRLHAAHARSPWCDEQRWQDRSAGTAVDTGRRHIRELTAESRLVVHSYDSTGILETLALNVPTMCFWHDGLNHLYPAVRPYYQVLREAGILADSPEDAALLVTSRWDDVPGWWGSSAVQAARRHFCEGICRTERRPVRTMRRLLLDACASTSPGDPR